MCGGMGRGAKCGYRPKNWGGGPKLNRHCPNHALLSCKSLRFVSSLKNQDGIIENINFMLHMHVYIFGGNL